MAVSPRRTRYPIAHPPDLAEHWQLERVTAPSRLFGANGLRTGPDRRIYMLR